MNSTAVKTADDTKSAACPLASLVLLAITHCPEAAPELLEPLGVSQGDIDTYEKDHAEALETIKGMAIAGALVDRKIFASLIRVRVGVKLIETEDPRQLATLVTAAAKLPAWVFGEEAGQEKPRGANAKHNGVSVGSLDNNPAITGLNLQNATVDAEGQMPKRTKAAKVKKRSRVNKRFPR